MYQPLWPIKCETMRSKESRTHIYLSGKWARSFPYIYIERSQASVAYGPGSSMMLGQVSMLHSAHIKYDSMQPPLIFPVAVLLVLLLLLLSIFQVLLTASDVDGNPHQSALMAPCVKGSSINRPRPFNISAYMGSGGLTLLHYFALSSLTSAA